MPASPSPAQPSATAGPFTLGSAAFAPGGAIPRQYTCDGADGSPELAWSGAPAGTAAFVLLVDDHDARDFVHWIVLDVPTTDNGLAKGVDPGAATPQQGTNDFGKPGWGGPCPPSGTHRYRFTLTALSSPLGLGGHPGGDAVRAALKAARASTLGTATLEATYRRGG
jgi:Raf kinase inhibitor-like YbhB/YbcL family protein